MKNQYFGDINDYHKYGLLRILSGAGAFRVGVCWMLTPDDGRTDGGKTQYLAKGDYRKYDPALFDFLRNSVKAGLRDVRQLELSGLLSSAVFHLELLTDRRPERGLYFDAMLKRFTSADLIFFDPDNGMEVKSKPYGTKGSSEYLYWHELGSAFHAGHSVIVFQHFPRVKREGFIPRVATAVQDITGAPEVTSFQTSQVVYFLASQPAHMKQLRKVTQQISAAWETQIQVGQHPTKRQAFPDRFV